MAVKNKKNKANASDSGSIVSYYMDRKKKYYDKYAKEQPIDGETGKEVTKRMSASGSGSIVSNYLDRRNKLYDLDEKKKKMEEEKAREENAKREREEKARAEKMDPNNWFTTSDGTKYKNPSLMGYDELQMVLNHVTENKDLFKKRLSDSGLFKKGFSGGWENVEPKDFEEKLGNNGVSWEDYKEYTSLWSKYQQNLEYMRELESQKPRVELEHEYDSLSDADKKIVSEAVDYEAELESNASTGIGISLADLRDKPITDAMRTADVYAKFPRLEELRDAGVDVDYIIESERTKRSNIRQKIRNSISADFADEHPILGSAASVASNLVSPVELAEDINHAIKNITSDKSYEIDYEMHPYSQYTNTTRGKVSEGIDNDIGKFVYNAGMSTIDSAADILVTKGLGKGKLASGAASAIMGANVANQTYMDTYERTGSAGQSLLTGVSAGLTEWATEKFSLESFSKLKTTTPKAFRDYAKNLVKQGSVEGSEEAAADFANVFADNAINGSKSEYNTAVKGYIQQGYTKEEAKKQATKDFFRQVAEDTMAGAFSGGLFGTYANIYSSVQYKNTVKKNGVSISENKEGNELVYYAEKHGMDTYDNEKETEKYGKISFDIMENAANRIDQAKSSNELSAVYREISQDIPDSLGVEVDQMVRTKAQSLAEDSQQPTEKQELIELMDDSLLRAIKRTEVLNKRKQQANESLSEEIPEETMNEEENTQESYPEERKENPVPDTPVQENVTTANFKRTENAAFTASDEVVKVKGFREIGTEDATVETSDGEVVSLADLSFEDVDTQNMFNIASKMENAAAATALVDHYDGRENAGVYANNFRMAYRMGRLGSISFDKMMQSSKEFRILSNKTPMRIAYEMGKAHEENEQRMEASVAPAHKMGQGEYTDNREAAEDQDSFGEVKKALARKTGLDVKDFDTLTEDDTATVNGMLSIQRGQMAFADDAENKFGVVIHESLEFASVMSEEDYNRLMGVVLNYLVDKHGVEDVHALIASYQKAYEAAEGKKTYEEAAGEMINDAVSGVFYDVDGAKSFIEWVMKDETLSGKEKKNLFQKMADLVKHIFDKIKEYIDNTPMTKAARMAAELKVEQKEEIRQLFMDAVDRAGEKYKAGKRDNVIRSQYSLKVDADVSEETIEKNRKDVGKMEDIVQISGFGLKKFGNSLMEQLEGFFEYVGGKVENKDYGTIELSRTSVKSLIRHRPTFLKQAAFEAIPTVLEKGRAIGYIKNRKNNVDSLIIAAPIEITDINKSGKYLVATSVNVTKDKNYLYLEEVFYRRINEGHTVQTRNLSTNNGDRESVYPSIISILNEIDKNVNENPTKENKDIRYSIHVDLDEQIDNVLNDTVPDNYTHVYLGETTEAFKELGWNDLPMLMTNQHVYSTIKTQEEAKKDNRFSKRRNYHGLGKELFEKVQKQMAKPAMILKSNTSEKNADVVFVTNVKDKQGNIVIAAVKPQGIGRVKDNLTSANVVLSVYGKNKIQNYIKNAYQENRILKMNPDEAVMPMVQFHGDLLHQDYKDNLTQYKEIVKNIISSKGEKHSISVSDRTEKLRHSLTDTMSTEESLVKENEYLRQVIKTLESEFKPGVKTVPEPSRVDAVCRKLLKKYHSTFDLETFKDNVTKLYAYMNEENADYEAALKITSEIARGVLEKSTQKDTTMYDTYKSLRDYFRKTKFSLSEAQKNEVKYLYGSMGEFRKSNFGRMRIVDEGTSLDQVWGELCEQYPELFHADTNDGDMITEVLNVLDGLRPVYRNVSGEDMEQGSYDLALQIYSEMSKVPQKQTFKDKAEAAVEYEWKESNRVYMNLLNDFRKECKKQFEEGLKVSLEEQNADKKQRIKEAYGKIRDYVNVIEVTQNGELIKKYQNEIEKQKRYIERLKKGQDRKIAELKMENRQYRSNLSEKRKQTEEKNKIRRLHARMRQMLMKPKEGMYVPQDLVRSVIDVCEAVNLGAKEGTKIYASLDEAKSCFDAMKSDPDYNFSSEYDEEVAYHLEQIKEKFRNAEKHNDKSIYDLSSQDLEEVYDAMNEVYQTIRRATKLIRKEGETDARKAAEKVIKEVRGAKGLSSWMSSHKVFRGMNRFIMKSLSSYRAFRRITGYADGEFMSEWKELNEGQRKMLQIQQEGESILAEVMEDKDVLELMKTFDKKEGLVDSGLRYKNGKKVLITKGMRMALVMHGMNQDNMRHMIYGGITLPNMDAYVKGDRKGAYDKTYEVEGITSAKIQAMEDAMSPEERKVLQAFKKLFHEYTGKVINETALELYGYKKANEKNYYPIHVDNDYVKTEINSVKMDKTIEGAGYLKDRVHSTKPLVMESIVDTAQRSLKMVSEFGGLAIPLRNFQKVYNGASWKVADTDGDGIKADSVMVQDDTVKKAMSDVWGQSASEYIDNLIADLQNARASEYTVFDQLRGNFAGAVLTGNVSVIMKQAASYPTAVATLGWEPVIKALGKGGEKGLPISRANRELIAKYTPLLWYRNKGNSTQEMADLSSMSNLTNRVPVVRDVKNMIQKVDVATVGRLWYAAQYYVDDHYKALKKGTDAYYQQVAEVFNRCVEDTQPNYTVMQRPEHLRNPDGLIKMLLVFMTQRMQNGGILYDASCNLYAKMKNGTETQKKEAKREFARAVSSQLVSAAVLSTMTFLARGLLHKINPYRDDENELTLLSFFEEWTNGVLESLSGSFIGGSELYTMIHSGLSHDTYYGIEVSLFSELRGIGEAFVEMANGLSKTTSDSDEEAEKGKEQAREAFLDAASGIAKMCGVPADNVKNIATGIWKNVEDVTSGEGLFSFSTDKEEPKATVYAKKIYDALMDGDKEAAKEYRSKMTKSGKRGEGDVETAVRTQLVKRNDLVRQAAEYRLNNNTDGYMKIYKQLKGMGFSHNEVVGSINGVLGDLKGESSSGPKAARDNISMYKAEDLIRAIEAEKGYEDILNQMYKEKVDSGKDDKEARAAIRASVTRVYKGKYRECKTAHEKQTILKKMYLLKIDGKCLYDNGILKKWNEDK